MSNEKQETISDIVAKMRADNPVECYPAEYGGGVIPNGTRELADRIEAAYKRLAIPTPKQLAAIAKMFFEVSDLKRENARLRAALKAEKTPGGGAECRREAERARLPDGVVGRASNFDPYEPGGVKSLNPGHAGTLINGSCPGCHSGVVEVYENHAQDCRVKPCGEVAPTLNGKMGTGGNNVPLKAECFVKVSHARGADGLGERWERGECAGTRNAIEGGDGRSQECVVLTNSNGEDVSPTLSRDCRSTGNQIEKNGGYVLERRVLSCGEGASPSPAAATGNEASVAAMRYVVRRLTPTECERLMGLPDGWTLPAFAPGEITDALVDEFRRIHDTFGAVMAGYAGKTPPKPKTAAWTRTWLERIANPATCPDAPRYKACGNGMATNQVRWIFLRVLAKEGIDPWNSEP